MSRGRRNWTLFVVSQRRVREGSRRGRDRTGRDGRDTITGRRLIDHR